MYIVIMAGGKGTRFWPRSRSAVPKQLLPITSRKTMLQETVERLGSLVSTDKIIVVTNTAQHDLVSRQIPEIAPENIIAEPVGKNTAPCICLAASFIQSRDPDETMVVLPADHYIGDPEAFCDTLTRAEQAALRTHGLITIGIRPTSPETGYGYIQHDTESVFDDMEVYAVKKFHEKPDEQKAREYVASCDFLWNSGMFVWRVSSILKQIRDHLPHVYEAVKGVYPCPAGADIVPRIAGAYHDLEGVSIDYGVMEKSDSVYTMIGTFAWNDIGSWAALYDLLPKDGRNNVLSGETLTVDTEDSFIHSPHRLTAVVGVKDIIIVDTKDALLVCDKNKCQDIRKIVAELDKKNMQQLL